MSSRKRKLYFTLEDEEPVKRFMAIKEELGFVSNINVLRFLISDRYNRITAS